jgi:hypothetical protein
MKCMCPWEYKQARDTHKHTHTHNLLIEEEKVVNVGGVSKGVVSWRHTFDSCALLSSIYTHTHSDTYEMVEEKEVAVVQKR